MASINVLLLSSDSEYNKRFGQYMSSRHTDIRLSIVDSVRNINQIPTMNSFSVILEDAEFASSDISLPERAAFAYLSSSDATDTLNGCRVFCKYRSGETLYKIILDLFSTVSSNRNVSNSSGSVYAFVGAGGGVGTSTLAAAFAKRSAASGAKTLYVNFDKFFDSSLFFAGDAIGNMSDLIFSVVASERNRNAVNLCAKAQALICRDGSGVCFIKSCNNPYEFNDLDKERIEAMYSALVGDPPFDVVVIDVPPHYDIGWELALNKADRIFVVTESRTSEETKLGGFLKMLRAYESHSEGVAAKTMLIVNRNSAGNNAAEQRDGIPVIGCVPRYNDNDVQGIINAMALLEMWNKL